MSGFDVDWLSLRAPADHAARPTEILTVLLDCLAAAPRVLDLGAGSGSNMAYLAPRLGAGQHWTLVDDDADLLAHAETGARSSDVENLRCIRQDLSEGVALLPLGEADLLTASAFLDLASARWIKASAQAAKEAKVPVILFALSVDGVIEWSARDTLDGDVAALFNRHMMGDKGLGAALGPDGWAVARDVLGDAGYRVTVFDSPWRLTARNAGLQRALLEGYANAAAEIEPSATDDIMAWKQRRARMIESAESGLIVGHKDVLAVL